MTGICAPNNYQKEIRIPVAPSNYSNKELVRHFEFYYIIDDNLQMLLNRVDNFEREKEELNEEVLGLRGLVEEQEDIINGIRD